MEHKIRSQRGYLLILATVLIIIATFIGSLLVSMFLGKTGATQNDLTSNAALYIATSGLEIAKRDIKVNHLSCTAIDGLAKYTNAAQFNGAFTVTGSSNSAATNLQSGINASDTSIPLVSSTNFTSEGVALIESELVIYSGVSGNTLLNATRGVLGTTAAVHSGGVGVSQGQCALTAMGGVPSLIVPEGKRILKQELLGHSGFSYGSATPTMVAVGKVTLSGNAAVVNSSVTSNSENFVGSTIVTARTASLGGSSSTQVSNGSGGLVVSSSKSGLAADVVQNYTGVTAGNLFGSYFSVPKATVQASANTLINHSISNLTDLNGVTGPVVWVNGEIDVSGNENVVVGTISSPVILIVAGDVEFIGTVNLTVNGILYTTGTIDTGGNAGLSVNGQLAAESSVTMKGVGTINFNSAVLSGLGSTVPSMLTNYGGNSSGMLREVFP